MYVAEFLGTALLVFTVGCCVLGGAGDYAGLSIGSVLFVAIQSLGAISGANFNPAVSFAIGLSGSFGGPGMPWSKVIAYALVQLVAGLFAALCFTTLYDSSVNVEPASGFSIYTAGVCELFYTFMLCFVVLNVAVAKKNAVENGQYFALAIGFVIIAGAYGAGAISGGCFNPAVALGLDATSSKSFGNSITYIGFELLGAFLAVICFRLVRPEEFGGNSQTISSKLISEFLGTFMLVLTVGLNVMAKSAAGALSIAASLASMIYALGDVSGANFNPAVTMAIFCSGYEKDMTLGHAVRYMVTQVLAGLAAGRTFYSIYDGKGSKLGPNEPTYTMSQAICAEAVFTFLLCFVVLSVAVSAQTKASHMFGLAIGFCVTVGGFAIGDISGGSLNPAVSFGLAAVGGGEDNAAVYSAVELGAGILAAGALMLTHDKELCTEEAKKLDV